MVDMTFQGAMPRTVAQRMSNFAVNGPVVALIGLFPLGFAFSSGGLLQTSDGERRGRGFAIAGVLISVASIAPVLWWYFAIRG